MRAKLFRYWLWVPRLLAVALLFWAGGRNWLLGSYWHNVGMRAYRAALVVTTGWDSTVSDLQRAISWNGVFLVKARLATATAKINPELAFTLSEPLVLQSVANNICAWSGGLPIRNLLADALVSTDLRFSTTSNWGFYNSTRYAKSTVQLQLVDGECRVLIVGSFTNASNRYSVLRHPVALSPYKTYKIIIQFKNSGLIASIGSRNLWKGNIMPVTETWQQADYQFINGAEPIDSIQVIISGGTGVLEMRQVLFKEVR